MSDDLSPIREALAAEATASHRSVHDVCEKCAAYDAIEEHNREWLSLLLARCDAEAARADRAETVATQLADVLGQIAEGGPCRVCGRMHPWRPVDPDDEKKGGTWADESDGHDLYRRDPRETAKAALAAFAALPGADEDQAGKT